MTGRTTVLVPEDFGVRTLASLPNLRPVRYGDGTVPLQEAAQAEVLVVSHVGLEDGLRLLEHLPELRLVQALTAGTDAWVDKIPAGVALANASGAGGAATAEWVLAALLAILRELPQSVSDQAAGHWRPRVTDSLLGKRVLILGAGDVGLNVRARMLPFGADVTMLARHARGTVLGLDALNDVLPTHGVLVVAVPLSDSTRGLLGARELARLPGNAVLVNASRGAVVDTDALLTELRAGRLRAALDVTDPEPLPRTHALWSAPGTLITPHLGGNTVGHQQRAWDLVTRQLRRYLSGEQLHNVVISRPTTDVQPATRSWPAAETRS
jgi:phosphoglycerate dehydrogenase-like enzyme